MKEQFKKLAALVLAGACLATSACGGKTKNSSTTEDGRILLPISNWQEEETNPVGYKRQMDKIERFEKEYPNIKVVDAGWSYDTETFAAKAEGHTLPVVYMIPFTETAKIMNLGYAVDITEKSKEYGYYDLINDFAMEQISRDGKVYYIPSECYSMALFLNLKLFEEAGLVESDGTPKTPETYDEMVSMAQTIKEKTGKAGFVFPTTDNFGGWDFTMFAWAFGAKFITQQEDGSYKATFDTPECAQALQFVKDMKWKYNVLPELTLVDLAEQQKQVATDQAAMTFVNLSMIGSFTSTYGMDINNIGLAKIPAGPAKRVSLMGGAYYAFSPDATPEQLDAAFKWITFDNDFIHFDDATKESLKNTYQDKVEKGEIVGIKELSLWNHLSEYQAYKDQLIDQFCNVNPNHLKSFNDKTGIEFSAEEPVCAQDLYSTLDSCLQEVLNNENADCAQVLKEANDLFQSNYLDYE